MDNYVEIYIHFGAKMEAGGVEPLIITYILY